MSDAIQHWSKTVNSIQNSISQNVTITNNIVAGTEKVGAAYYADNAKKDGGDHVFSDYYETIAAVDAVENSFDEKLTHVVDLTSSQDVGGNKTFTSNVTIKHDNNPSVTIKSTDLQVGVKPTVEEVAGVQIVDKNDVVSGAFRKYYEKDGSTYSEMYVSNGTVDASVSVDILANGTKVAYAPSTPSGSTGNEIVTANFIKDFVSNGSVSAEKDSSGNVISSTYIKDITSNGTTLTLIKGDNTTDTVTTQDTTYETGTSSVAGLTKLYTSSGSATDGTMTQNAINSALAGKLDASGTAVKATADASGNTITTTYATKSEVTTLNNDVVHKTGAETISGVKTFSDDVVVSNVEPVVSLKDTNLTLGVVPTSEQVQRIAFVDSTDAWVADVKSIQSSNGDYDVSLDIRQPTSSSTNYARLGIAYPKSGTPYAYTTASTDANNDNSLVTVGYLSDNLNASAVGLGNVTNESKATMFTNAALTGTPTAPTASNSTNSTQIATTAFVQSLVNSKVAGNDAMVYKGTIGTGGTVTALPTTHEVGWTYKVITAGSYAGNACNVGDMIICLTDGTAANNAHWTVVEGNIDGAVTGPASSVSGNVVLFDGTTGKMIKDSGLTLGVSVPENALFTDTNTKVTQTISSNNEELPILARDTISTTTSTTTSKFASGVTINPSTNAITATTFNGSLEGNALTATNLKTAKLIDGVSFNGGSNVTHFAICSTDAATAAKTVSCANFSLVNGARIIVQFSTTNTAENPTLNVNSTGAKSIYYRGEAISAGNLAAKRIYEFVYDGSEWEVVGDINTDINNKAGQYVTTTNAEYPLITTYTAGLTANKTDYTRFASGVTLNPSTGTITATKFKGALDGNAATATTASACSGNAATATTASACSGNAATATKLAASKNIALTGDVTGSAGFDGSAAASIATTLAASGVTAGSYGPSADATLTFGGTFTVPYITVDSKGRTTAASNVTYTLPSDTKVKQTITTGNAEYALLAMQDAAATATKTNGSRFASNVTLNPSTGRITANGINSSLSTGTYIAGNQGTAIINSTSAGNGYTALFKLNSTNGAFTMAQHQTKIVLAYTDQATITAGTNNVAKIATLLDESGNAVFPGTLTANTVYNAVWNDYAEFFPRGEETEAGDIVALSLDHDDEVYVKASKETSKAVGIHSDSFGHLIGGELPPEGEDFVEYNLERFIPVGLIGRVRTKLIGAVKKGDFIVISDIPGVGRAYDKDIDNSLDVIGIACETSNEEGIRRVKMKLVC